MPDCRCHNLKAFASLAAVKLKINIKMFKKAKNVLPKSFNKYQTNSPLITNHWSMAKFFTRSKKYTDVSFINLYANGNPLIVQYVI